MHSQYDIVELGEKHVILCDLHNMYDNCLTITNDIEWVVARLWRDFKKDYIFYIDSEGVLTEAVHENGVFISYALAEYKNQQEIKTEIAMRVLHNGY